MTRPRARIGLGLGSLAGRTIVVLVLGLAVATIASLLVAQRFRLRELDQARRAGLVDTLATTVDALRRQPAATERALIEDRVPGIRAGVAALPAGERDEAAERLLSARIGEATLPRIVRARVAACGEPHRPAQAATAAPPPACWLVGITMPDGRRRHLVVDVPFLRVYQSAFADPIFLLLLLFLVTALAIFVTRATILPLRRLTEAAQQFSIAADPVDVHEHGPRELRTALRTFNLMQQRVRDGIRERTHILAAISHDLQTPLTRLRLRVEQVADYRLRAELVEDLAVMQRLVGEGLDLARSTERQEPWSLVDIDSVLSSLADDLGELGANVRLGARAGVRVRVRLSALVRTVENLADNAVKYGGEAELGAAVTDGMVVVTVRDHGPGIPDGDIAAAFAPFTRLASAAGEHVRGTGLGLTIARAQAATFGATVTLANHPSGGLLATVTMALDDKG